MLDLLKAELEMTMRLTGCQRLSDIKESMVITDNLKARHPSHRPTRHSARTILKLAPTMQDHIATVPRDNLFNGVYVPPGLPEYGAAVAEAVKLALQKEKTEQAPSAGWALIKAFIADTLKTIVAPSAKEAVYRSAIFLFIFLGVHMGGNLAIFLGDESLNFYGYHLAR